MRSRAMKVHISFDALIREMQKELEPKMKRQATFVNITKLVADEMKRRKGKFNV